MSVNFHTARYILESARCAVVTADDGSFLLGYFLPPRHEWMFVASFADEATARRAFQVFDASVAEFRRAWGPKREGAEAKALARSAA